MRTLLALCVLALLAATGCQYTDTADVNEQTTLIGAEIADGKYENAALRASSSFVFIDHKGNRYKGIESFCRVSKPLVDRRGADLYLEHTAQSGVSTYAVVGKYLIDAREWKLKFTWEKEANEWKLAAIQETAARPPAHVQSLSSYSSGISSVETRGVEPNTGTAAAPTTTEKRGGNDARLSAGGYMREKAESLQEK